jgi:5'-methylthioadenosine phosphorylase
MLKDLTRDDWLGALDLPPGRVPSVLVLRGTRNLRANYDKYRAHFADVLEIGSPNDLFEDIFVGRRDGVDVGYASVYGPAMASEITHLFGVLGTGLVIQTGVCGALAEGIAAGDLVVATSARCAEGAAACYLPGALTVEATPELVAEVMAEPTVSVPRHAGPVWTTPALLAEGEAEIEQWHGEGYIAADMETATTFAVAAAFGMRRLSLLSVFDNPREGAHLGLTEAHKDEARAAGERAMLTLLFALIARHGAAPAVPDGRVPVV